MKKILLAAAAFGAAIAASPSAFAAEDCLGVSIGPGCLGLGAQRGDHVYRRVETRPANPRVYVAPDGGRYYYDDNTYYYEERH